MRLTYLDIDITTAELAESPKIAAVIDRMIRSREEAARTAWVGRSDADPGSSDLADIDLEEPTPADPIPGVSPDGQAVVQKMLDANSAGELFRAFLAEVTTWSDVALHGSSYEARTRPHRGTSAGTFAFVDPGLNWVASPMAGLSMDRLTCA